MPITFIPNDPDTGSAVGAVAIAIEPTADAAASRTSIEVSSLSAEAEYALDSAEFIAWQSREAALRAIGAFEEAYGDLPGWRGVATNLRLPLLPIAGEDVNAYYNRRSISMFRATVRGKLVYSGASTDVVAHETGHAILDAIRPDLFGVNMIEPGAFHEGFGDCIAVLTALADQSLRAELLAGGADLRRQNGIESLAEQLSAAIAIVAGPKHNAGAPRHAFNDFRWAFPSSLPMKGPPGTLINEEHSLGQLVGGIYYDLLVALFERDGAGDEAALWTAAKEAIALVARAAVRAPIKPRFLESWGRTMMVIDREANAGRNEDEIRAAFERHGLAVGAANFLSPRVMLRRSSSKRRAPARRARRKTADTLAAGLRSTKSAVREVLDFEAGTPLEARELDFGGRVVTQIAGRRDVDLSGIDPRLDDVKAPVSRPALVGEVDDGPALLGAIDPNFTYDSEVREFAASLIARDAIAFYGDRKPRGGPAFVAQGDLPTHRVVSERGEKVLKRIAFRCGCRNP